MTRIKTQADLKQLRELLQDRIRIQGEGGNPESVIQVKVAMATCGIASGAREVMTFFAEELEKRGIDAVVTQVGCMGYCYAEPTVEITLPGTDPVVYGFVDRRRADEIIERYIKNGDRVDDIIPVTYLTINEE